MFWITLILLTGACWYFAVTKPRTPYPRDWRLKPFDLPPEDEQQFHRSVRQVLALTGAIFFSVYLIITLVFAPAHI